MTLAAFSRFLFQDLSWSKVRALIAGRFISINGETCCDPARRVQKGEMVMLAKKPAAKITDSHSVKIRFIDAHIVVVEKPVGMNSVRHPAERDWKLARKKLSPTLDDTVSLLIQGKTRLRVVHRLDKETSGLLVFARTVAAERGLGSQFHNHTVVRKYFALVPGRMGSRRIESLLVRDRGDGRRGSTSNPAEGKKAVTHIDFAEAFPRHTLLQCQLETGKTHQIRIHLAELGHPVCGDKVYRTKKDGTVIPGVEDFPRLALHARELGFQHPISGEFLHWTMEPPEDFQNLLRQLRESKPKHGN